MRRIVNLLTLVTAAAGSALVVTACTSEISSVSPSAAGSDDAASGSIGEDPVDTKPPHDAGSLHDAKTSKPSDAATGSDAAHDDDASPADAGAPNPPDAAPSCPPGGCNVNVVVPWDGYGDIARSVVSDGTSLFFYQRADSRVQTVAASGTGAVSVVAHHSNTDVYGMLLSGSDIYACAGSLVIPPVLDLWVAPKSGSNATGQVLTSITSAGHGACAIADDGVEIFFFTDAEVRGIHKTTHAARTVKSNVGWVPDSMAVDANNLYVGTRGVVESLPKSGAGSFTRISTSTGFSPNVRYLTVVGNALFWIDGEDGLVRRYPLPSGPVQIINAGAPTPGASPRLAVDANGVYWTAGDFGTIYRAPLTGGAAVPVVTGLTDVNVNAIALDANRLYFAVTEQSFLHPQGLFSVPR